MHRTLQRALAVGTTAALALSALTASAPTASAAAPSLTKAANYLVRNLPTSADGVGTALTTANAFAATGDCTYAPAARTLVSQITKGAKAYLYPGKKLNQARAANLAITVKALGLNPKSFAGYNLVSLITKSLPKDGQIGSTKSAFSQSLGIIALKRASATIPVTLLTNLLSQQDVDSGAFGYEWPAGTFNADPDTTAMGLLGLETVGQLKPQVTAAVNWATAAQTAEGYWQNYSPVDSTGLVGSALTAAGRDASVAKAKSWLGTVQHSDGGFPNALDAGTPSDVTATANALWLLTGKSLLDVSMNLGKCPPNPPSLPKATTACTGVWVVVDRGNGQDTVRCASKYATGLQALSSAGFKPGYDLGGRMYYISGFPYLIGDVVWRYWHATPSSDGTWGDWQLSADPALQYEPKQGDAEGWVYGDGSPTNTPPLGYATTGQLTITGTAKVGQTLTAVPGTWNPEPTFSYRWYRSGSSIAGATKSTYKLTKSDAGKTITVKVTGTLAKHQTVALTSAPTAKVSK